MAYCFGPKLYLMNASPNPSSPYYGGGYYSNNVVVVDMPNIEVDIPSIPKIVKSNWNKAKRIMKLDGHKKTLPNTPWRKN